MNDKNVYISSDLYLTAYLKTKGFKFTLNKEKTKTKFVFEETQELINYVNEYLTENGVCEPLAYTNAIKNIKNLLYNNK